MFGSPFATISYEMQHNLLHKSLFLVGNRILVGLAVQRECSRRQGFLFEIVPASNHVAPRLDNRKIFGVFVHVGLHEFSKQYFVSAGSDLREKCAVGGVTDHNSLEETKGRHNIPLPRVAIG